jgi:hypothetical protein
MLLIILLSDRLIDLIISLLKREGVPSAFFLLRETIEDFAIFKKANFSFEFISLVNSIEACI